MAQQIIFSDIKRKVYELDAKTIAYYRRNPIIAARDLLGVELFDAQKYILQNTWNCTHSVWSCSRNLGKSFMGAILLILKAVLYENKNIYIVSSVGDQSKELFTKIEEIILRMGKTAASIRSLKDIMEKETKKSPTNKTGFSHNPAGYEVSFYNGSTIFTLNSNPDNNRSRRADVVFFDEAAFCSDELIVVCEAFATQSSDFKTSVDYDYDPSLEHLKVPTQLIYASSQDNMDKLFYKHYKSFAKKMLLGDRNYFCADMICDVAIHPYMYGKPYPSLLSQNKVDAAMKGNKIKALREYYNVPTLDSSTTQIIKWGNVRRNEKYYLPTLYWQPNQKIVLAFDPARTTDNSIIGAMKIYQDKEYGWCGDIVNMVNLIDVASKNKYKLDSNKQKDNLKQIILNYNGINPDYENIDSILIDAGAGGGGQSTYADGLLKDWVDKTGKIHRGLIDKSHPVYKDLDSQYPNAVDKLRLINPSKYRTQMVEEFIELFELGVMHLPYEFNGQNYIQVAKIDDNGEEYFETQQLTDEEMTALSQIDLMKNEITSIHKIENAEKTVIRYALPDDLKNKLHDDRFYVMILLAHRLYELRRKTITDYKPVVTQEAELFSFKTPNLYKLGKQ